MILGYSRFLLCGSSNNSSKFVVVGVQLAREGCDFLVRVVENGFCERVFAIGELEYNVRRHGCSKGNRNELGAEAMLGATDVTGIFGFISRSRALDHHTDKNPTSSVTIPSQSVE